MQVKTASLSNWAVRDTALKVQLNEVISSLTAMPIDFPNIELPSVPDLSDIANNLRQRDADREGARSRGSSGGPVESERRAGRGGTLQGGLSKLDDEAFGGVANNLANLDGVLPREVLSSAEEKSEINALRSAFGAASPLAARIGADSMQEEMRSLSSEVLNLLALLVQKYKYRR
jgi:hypothetical protein